MFDKLLRVCSKLEPVAIEHPRGLRFTRSVLRHTFATAKTQGLRQLLRYYLTSLAFQIPILYSLRNNFYISENSIALTIQILFFFVTRKFVVFYRNFQLAIIIKEVSIKYYFIFVIFPQSYSLTKGNSVNAFGIFDAHKIL